MAIYDQLREAFSGEYNRAAPQVPILMGQTGTESLGDPRLTQLFFGTAGEPGYLQQLRSAATGLIGQEVPLQQTAGLTDLESLALQQARSGIGAYQPFLSQQENLINQAIEQSRLSQQLQEPYFGRAEQQLYSGIGGLESALGEAGGLLRGTLGRTYDPRMTQMFMDPYESSVVQQTIQDALQASTQQDIQQRAADISRGGESAFGSRARLGAEERQRAFGRGLGETLSGIRSRGFGQAQQLGLGEFGRQLQTQTGVASGLAGLGQQMAGARSGLASGLLGIGQQRGAGAAALGQQLAGYGGQLGQLGGYGQQLAQQQRQELMGLGQVPRSIQEQQYQRQFAQQTAQQQRPLSVLSGIGGLLPQYRATTGTIASQYGLPRDPLTAGLQGAAGLYGGLYTQQYGYPEGYGTR